MPNARHTHRSFAWRRVLLICMAVAGLVMVVGCGSSKPGYCTARTNLETSIKGLSSLNVSSGISGLETQLAKIQSNAQALINAAKSDFPSQTSAIKTSVDSLVSAVKALAKSPSPAQIAGLANDATSLGNSVKSFMSATSSKCS
jgi:hypothetical protein